MSAKPRAEPIWRPADADIAAIVPGRHGDPFAVLGMHGGGDKPLSVGEGVEGVASAVWAPNGERVSVVGDRDHSLDWHLLDDTPHRNMQNLVRDLNRLYREAPALHVHDAEPAGFEWHGRPQSLSLDLPPLATIILQHAE